LKMIAYIDSREAECHMSTAYSSFLSGYIHVIPRKRNQYGNWPSPEYLSPEYTHGSGRALIE